MVFLLTNLNTEGENNEFNLGPLRGERDPLPILCRVWQLLVTAVCTKTGKRLIQTSRTLFALLKVINHCGHRGAVPLSASAMPQSESGCRSV